MQHILQHCARGRPRTPGLAVCCMKYVPCHTQLFSARLFEMPPVCACANFAHALVRAHAKDIPGLTSSGVINRPAKWPRVLYWLVELTTIGPVKIVVLVRGVFWCLMKDICSGAEKKKKPLIFLKVYRLNMGGSSKLTEPSKEVFLLPSRSKLFSSTQPVKQKWQPLLPLVM